MTAARYTGVRLCVPQARCWAARRSSSRSWTCTWARSCCWGRPWTPRSPRSSACACRTWVCAWLSTRAARSRSPSACSWCGRAPAAFLLCVSGPRLHASCISTLAGAVQAGGAVSYPGLPSHPQHALLQRLANPGYGHGGLLTLVRPPCAPPFSARGKVLPRSARHARPLLDCAPLDAYRRRGAA